MDSFIHKLKKNIILSKEDILLLRKTINEENPYLDNSAKAHILARSIHNRLDESLKGFTKDYKSNIKTDLIRNTFLNNKESIYQYDVLKACSASQDTSLEFIYQVNKWVSKQTNEEITLNIIKDVIQEIYVETEQDIKDDISLSKILEENDENTFESTQGKISNVEISDAHNSVDDKEFLHNEDDSDIEYLENHEDSLDNDEPPNNEDTLTTEELPIKDTSDKISKEYSPFIKYIIELKKEIFEIIKTNISNENIRKYILIYSLALCLLIIPAAHFIKMYIEEREAFFEIVLSPEYNDAQLDFGKDDTDIIISEELALMTSHLPDHLKYRQINEEGLRDYLIERNSLLSKEPYFSTIIECAKEFNLNPVLLFSIAGHEQSFVPQDHTQAKKIVNNPYNVFQSWKKYNTDLTDSSKIASRTVINHLKDRPEDEDPFKWINKKYAEDKNWWKGVREIYYTLEEKAK